MVTSFRCCNRCRSRSSIWSHLQTSSVLFLILSKSVFFFCQRMRFRVCFAWEFEDFQQQIHCAAINHLDSGVIFTTIFRTFFWDPFHQVMICTWWSSTCWEWLTSTQRTSEIGTPGVEPIGLWMLQVSWNPTDVSSFILAVALETQTLFLGFFLLGDKPESRFAPNCYQHNASL